MLECFRARRDELKGQIQFADDQLKALRKFCNDDCIQEAGRPGYIKLRALQFESELRLTVYTHSVIKQGSGKGKTRIHLKTALEEIERDRKSTPGEYAKLYLDIFSDESKNALKLLGAAKDE